MRTFVHEIMSMSFPAMGGRDMGGLTNSLPLPVLILAVIVLAISVFGIFSRIKDIAQGKGTAMDFIGIIVVLMMLALVVFVMGSGVVRGLM